MRESVISLLESVPVLIASGQSISASIDLGGLRLGGVIIPAAWTTANLTFQISTDNSTFYDLYDSLGVEYTVVVTANKGAIVSVVDMAAIRYIKIRSGTSSVPVTQGADRTLTLLTRQV